MYLKINLLKIFVLLLWVVLPVKVYANDSSLNLTLSPTFLQFETAPGTTKTAELRIRNNGTGIEKLKITIGRFKIDASGEKPELLDLRENDESTLWVIPEKYEIQIEPQKWDTLKINFVPPQYAALSYYYVIYLSRTDQSIDSGVTNVIGSPAILTLATVTSPNARKELHLESFTAKKGFLEYLPQEFELKIRNTGNVNVVPTGNIFINSAATRDVGVLSINPIAKVILPDSTRTFTVVWDDGFPLRKEKLVWDLANASKFRLGRFTADALLVYDNGLRDVPLESSLSFWVFPITLVLLALGVLLMPALFVFVIMKILAKRRDSKITQIHN